MKSDVEEAFQELLNFPRMKEQELIFKFAGSKFSLLAHFRRHFFGLENLRKSCCESLPERLSYKLSFFLYSVEKQILIRILLYIEGLI